MVFEKGNIMKKLFTLYCLLFTLFTSLLLAETIEVKQDSTGNFTTIQEGINASVDSDTVLVYPGTYYENLDMNGKNITLASLELITGEEAYIDSTVIDGQRQESCIRVHNGETNANIQGFTIQNGFGTQFWANDGGGLLVHDYSTAYVTNCVFKNNLAAQGGGIYARHGFLHLSGLRIIENSASWGGAIFMADDSTVNFDVVNRCNLYNNNASKGSEIFTMDTDNIHVVVDTFSVFNPDRFFAEYMEESTYTFDIQNNWMELVPHDLYVAVDGDDNNSGLTPEEPLRNISWAVRRIESDSLNHHTVHVATGTYSWESNQQIYPIGCKEYVSIIGEDKETTILNNDFTVRTINGYNLNGTVEISNFTIKNDFEPEADMLIYFYKIDSLIITNVKMSNNENLGRIFYNEWVHNNFRNLSVRNNFAEKNSGIQLDNNSGLITNCIFENNSLFQNSGPGRQSAFYLYAHDDVLIENCVFSDCTSYDTDSNTIRTTSQYGTEPNIIMKNCLISGNQSNSNRVIDIFGKGSNQFINCTIADNTSNMNTIKAYGDITLTNTIMHNNTNYEVYMVDEIDTYELNIDYCSIKNGEGGIYNQNNANIINWGEGNIDEYPLFDSLETYPFAFLEGSPCIDTGTPDTTGLYLPPWDLLHNYRVWDGDNNGTAIIDMGCYEFGAPSVGTNEEVIQLNETNLYNYPNPFNPTTTIKFNLLESGDAKLEIYNIKGQKVKILMDCYTSPGDFELIWNGRDENNLQVGSGIYFYQLNINGNSEAINKMILMK